MEIHLIPKTMLFHNYISWPTAGNFLQWCSLQSMIPSSLVEVVEPKFFVLCHLSTNMFRFKGRLIGLFAKGPTGGHGGYLVVSQDDLCDEDIYNIL